MFEDVVIYNGVLKTKAINPAGGENKAYSIEHWADGGKRLLGSIFIGDYVQCKDFLDGVKMAMQK